MHSATLPKMPCASLMLSVAMVLVLVRHSRVCD